jgi:glycosyltransferase involved in cell wall biosynthesis
MILKIGHKQKTKKNKIVFISHYYYPHVGGVEKHVLELSKALSRKNMKITVITKKFDDNLKDKEIIRGIKIIRIKYPKIKIIGIAAIWLSLLKNIRVLTNADIIHIHDVFVWFIPFKLLIPSRNVATTIHGFEADKPFSINSIFQKKLAKKLSNRIIGIGKYLEKYYGIKFDLILYGGINLPQKCYKKTNKIIFLGRLSKDTGVIKFLKWLDRQKYPKVDFLGDGELRKQCERYGEVHGFKDPTKFLKHSKICVPGGYLGCLEAFANKCEVKIFWQDNFKKYCWQSSPMYKFIKQNDIQGAYNWVKSMTWSKLADEHIHLYNSL